MAFPPHVAWLISLSLWELTEKGGLGALHPKKGSQIRSSSQKSADPSMLLSPGTDNSQHHSPAGPLGP